ncbi:MAG: TlpA family protein disulfide reductase [Xanthomonadales bacterium]|nr:TlpA family protein disulfide reductase [Xanthomonadales bacterium]
MNILTKRPLARLALVFALATVVAACQTNGGVNPGDKAAESAQPEFEDFIVPGDVLPIESVIDVNGKTVDLADPDKRKLVILFATWCKDSNRALKALNASELLNDDAIVVIAIAREESDETVIAWRDENGIETPLAADPDRGIYKQFATAGIPRFIMVGTDNRVIKMNLAETEDPLSLIEWQ